MLDNIMGVMQENLNATVSIISSPIVYQHMTNNSVVSTTNTTASNEPTGEYRINGNRILDGIKFYLTPNIVKDGKNVFLNLEAKINDTVLFGGKKWYVITTETSEMQQILICSTSKITLDTKSVKFR